MAAVTVLFAVLADILILAEILGTVVPGLPGAALVLAGIVWLAWLEDFERLGAGTITVLVVLTVGFHTIDLLATAVGARRVGASRRAVAGALIGTLAGLFFGLPGLVIGPFAGAFIGEFSKGQPIARAGRVGLGTWLGILLGAVIKLALLFAIVGIAAAAFLFG